MKSLSDLELLMKSIKGLKTKPLIIIPPFKNKQMNQHFHQK